MMYKKILATGLVATMIAGTTLTSVAAGPGGMGMGPMMEERGHEGGGNGPDMQSSDEDRPDGGLEQQMEENFSGGMEQPAGGFEGQRQDAPEMPRGEENMTPPEKPQGEEDMTPPDAPEGEAETAPPEISQGEEEAAPPEKPQGEEGTAPSESAQGEEGTPPEIPQGEEMTPPEKPEGEEDMAPPEKPEGEENMTPPEKTEGEEDMTPPEKPEGEEDMTPPEKPQEEDEVTGPEKTDNETIVKLKTLLEEIFGEDGSFDRIWQKIQQLIGFGPKDRSGDAEQPQTPESSEKQTEDGQEPPVLPGSEDTDSERQRPEMPGRPGEGGMEFPGGGQSAPSEYEAANTVTEDAQDQEYTSESGDENAILVDGSEVTLSNITVSKTGDSSGESADFYGINAGVLADNGASLVITESSVETDGTHANGIFSYGEGTTVEVSSSTITTNGDNSGGLMTTGGGTLIADDVTITTSGNSSAAIRTDRGGGTVAVSDSTGSTGGVGSPAIYSTADITVTNSTLTADKSEAVVIEGGNSVMITDSELTGNNSVLNGQSTTSTNVLIYQSMSGDASEGESEFEMVNGSLTAITGSMFHVTNVTTTINLTNVTLNYSDDSDVFLDISADSWGTAGSNGGKATVNLSRQTVEGNIIVDDSSSLTLNITASSEYTGSINSDGAQGEVSVVLEEGSVWTLAGDAYIDSFDGDLSNVNLNGYTLYINGVAYTG